MTVLSGADAKKFLNQVRYGRPKKAAIESLKRGRELLAEMNKHGKITIHAPLHPRPR